VNTLDTFLDMFQSLNLKYQYSLYVSKQILSTDNTHQTSRCILF